MTTPVDVWMVKLAVPTPAHAAMAGWLVTLVPSLVGSVVVDAVLLLDGSGTQVLLRLGMDHRQLEPAHRQRVAFWTRMAGGEFWDLTGAQSHRAAEAARMLHQPSAYWGGDGSKLAQQAHELLTSLKLGKELEALAARGALLDLDPSNAAAPALGRAGSGGVFLECPLQLPVGDEVTLHFPATAPASLAHVPMRVVNVRREAGALGPAGFGVVPLSPTPAVVEALACFAVSPKESGQRAHPRFITELRLRYASDEEFSEDCVSNLSFGGAFVTTKEPAELNTSLPLVVELRSGLMLRLSCRVVALRPGGMAVEFTLDQDTQRALAAELTRISCRPKCVLLVDDNQEWRHIMRTALGQAGLKVLEAQDGAMALEILTDGLMEIDMVILDVEMPIMGGEQMLTTVRQAGGEVELPIIAMTASEDAELLHRLSVEGADLVLNKSLPLARLVKESIQTATLKRQRFALGTAAAVGGPAAW